MTALSMPECHAATILLVDDHPLMRKGLRSLLEGDENLNVIGEAADGEEAIAQVLGLSPDVVVMDISMPKLNGIEATRRILAESPATRVIALSIHAEKRFVDDMLQAGATAYVLKDSVPEELAQAIYAVQRGETFLSAPILGTVLTGYRQATDQTASDHIKIHDDGVVEPILLTKLHRPPLPLIMIPRRLLLERLQKGRTRPLTLISAPAGYGKSVMIGSWLGSSDWPNAWLSLDSEDSDLRQFMRYFVAAVQTAFPGACAESLRLIESPELPPIGWLANTLINELDDLNQPFILVLDDYHRISITSAVNDLLSQLLTRPPIPFHLVILTRRDPPLPLVTLRAEGQMTELRMQDLRFNAEETRAFLEKSLNVTLTQEVLANLECDIEGWVVGLRLMALASRQLENPGRLLESPSGGVQQAREYLFQEVINNQSPFLRDCLLKCAILDRFCAPLCEALCAVAGNGKEPFCNGGTFIESLTEANLFIIPLDTRGEWYRLHHLFQELLSRELSRHVSATEIAELHTRASAWYEAHGLINKAIEHALHGAGVDTAADIIERNHLALLNQDKWHILDAWLDKLPSEVVHQRPILLLCCAYIAFFRQQFTSLVTLIEEMDALQSHDQRKDSYSVELDFFRGYLDFWSGNIALSEKALEKVIAQAPKAKRLLIAEAELHLSIVRHMRGKGGVAIAALNRRIAELNTTSGPLLSRLVGGLAILQMFAGHLLHVRGEAKRMRELATQCRTLLSDSWGYYLEAMADLHGMNLPSAQRNFMAAIKHPYSTDARAAIDAMAGLSLTYQLLQMPDAADATLQQLLNFAHDSNDHVHVDVARACEARIRLLQGDFVRANHWAVAASEPLNPFALFLWLEVPVMTQARILITDGSAESLSKASTVLREARDLSESQHITCQAIEIRVLQALLLEKQEGSDRALRMLEEAIALAEPGGWLRPFVELGQPMANLLGRLTNQRGLTDFTRQLLDALQAIPTVTMDATAEASLAGATVLTGTDEALTKREMDILALLAQRLQNKEIANLLFVSPETVKTHLKHLYQKLQVSNRREAAIKAAEIQRASVHTEF